MAKKKKCPECEACEKWAVPTADFFSLLLALFIALYAIASVNSDKAKLASQAFVEIFKTPPRTDDAPVLPIPPPPGKSDSDAKLQKSGSPNQMEDISKMLNKIREISDKEGTGSQTEVVTTPEGVKIRGFDGVVFEKGSAELSMPFRRVLAFVATVLRQAPNQVKIEGYATPGDADGSSYPSTWELSGARAGAVIRYLSEGEKIDSKRFLLVGHGQMAPLNQSNAQNFLNRRVEITIMNYAGMQDFQGPTVLDEKKGE